MTEVIQGLNEGDEVRIIREWSQDGMNSGGVNIDGLTGYFVKYLDSEMYPYEVRVPSVGVIWVHQIERIEEVKPLRASTLLLEFDAFRKKVADRLNGFLNDGEWTKSEHKREMEHLGLLEFMPKPFEVKVELTLTSEDMKNFDHETLTYGDIADILYGFNREELESKINDYQVVAEEQD